MESLSLEKQKIVKMPLPLLSVQNAQEGMDIIQFSELPFLK
jgi:hypothetical protein